MTAQIPPPNGSLPLLESDRDDTDPDIFDRNRVTQAGFSRQSAPDQKADTVPRCITCGRRVDDSSQFDQGVTWALQGVNFMLAKRMPKAEADMLTLWLQHGLT